MSDYERKLADELIKKSTVDGKLDFNLLRTNTNDKAKEVMQNDGSYREMRDANQLGALREFYMARLTVATREVLGIIPQANWDHTDGRDDLTKLLQKTSSLVLNIVSGPPLKEAEFHPTHGLTCTVPGAIDPKKSLAQQGVVCSTTKPSAQR